MTPAFCPDLFFIEMPNPVYSVVAVCGLMGHAYGSWSAKSHDGHRTMWLRSFMEQDYPQVRTMVYGYDAAIDPKSTTITQLPDYANDFLEVLKLARSSEEVGH